MKRMLFLYGYIVLCAIQLGCNANPVGPDAPPPNVTKIEESLFFKGVRTSVHPPSQIKFLFSLHDAQNHALFFDQHDLESRIRIFEDDVEIDYVETNFIVKNARNFRQDVVLILDFSSSVQAFGEGDVSAIDRMIAGSKALIRILGPNDRLAIVEFHDRYLSPQILSYFSSDTSTLLATIDAFARLQVDHGASRLWDAAHTGLELFAAGSQPEGQRLLIIISDGGDTSSRAQPEEVMHLARQKSAQLFIAGIGASQHGETLQQIADATDGLFLNIEAVQEMRAGLSELIKNVRCQYALSYVSLQQNAQPTVRVQIEHAGKMNSFSQPVDLSGVAEADKDDRVGRIAYTAEKLADNRAKVILRLEHAPRNVRQLRFKLGTQALQQIKIVPQASGGVLDSTWQLSQDSVGWFVLQSENSTLPFGAFGSLLEAEFAATAGRALRVPLSIDNSIYSDGKRFIAPDILLLSIPISNPAPRHGGEAVARRPQLSWEVSMIGEAEAVFDLFLDTEAPVLRQIATGVQGTSYQPDITLAANKTYFWKVVARIDGNYYSSPIWHFTTGEQ